MTAPMATQPDVCGECSGRGGFYSDNGPAPRWETCDYCEGAGDWDDIGYIEPVRSPVMMGGFTEAVPHSVHGFAIVDRAA